MSIRAFLFDMDGLLMDTEALHIRAYVELTARLGRPQKAEALTRFIGHSNPTTCRWLIDEVGCKGTVEELAAAESQIYHELLEKERPAPLAGVREMFDLGDSLKFSRALVSSSADAQVDPTMQIIIDHLGRGGDWRDHFNAIATGDRVTHRKPAPDLYQLAMRELKLTPDECIAFEDSHAGVSSALAAGLRVVAIPNFHLNSDEVVQNRTPLVFETLLHASQNLDRILL